MRNIYFAIVGIFLFLAGGFVAAQQPLPENVLQPPLGKSSIAFSDPNYRDEIRSIVVELSRYTKARNPDFIVMGMGSLDLLVKTRQDAVREKANAPNIPISQTLPLGAPWPTYLHSFDGVILDSPFCFYPTENDIRAAIGPISRDLSDDQKAAELERGTRQALLNEIDRQLGFATLLRNEGGSIFAINRCNSLQSAVLAEEMMFERKIIGSTVMQDRLAIIPTERPKNENPENIHSLSQVRTLLPLIDLPISGGEAGLRPVLGNNFDMLIISPLLRTPIPMTSADVKSLRYKAMGSRRLVLAALPLTVALNTAFYWEENWKAGNPPWLVTPNKRGDGMVVRYWDPAWKKILGQAIEGIVNMGFDGVVLTDMDSYRVFEAMDPLLE